ncbi:MAG: hypothetical protein WDN24_11925 [Sphingomonas sp.]
MNAADMPLRASLLAFAASLALGTAAAAPRGEGELPADLILTDAKVVTIDAADTRAEAVAVRDGRIVAVEPGGGDRDLAGTGDRSGRPRRPHRAARLHRLALAHRQHGERRAELHQHPGPAAQGRPGGHRQAEGRPGGAAQGGRGCAARGPTTR